MEDAYPSDAYFEDSSPDASEAPPSDAESDASFLFGSLRDERNVFDASGRGGVSPEIDEAFQNDDERFVNKWTNIDEEEADGVPLEKAYAHRVATEAEVFSLFGQLVHKDSRVTTDTTAPSANHRTSQFGESLYLSRLNSNINPNSNKIIAKLKMRCLQSNKVSMNGSKFGGSTLLNRVEGKVGRSVEKGEQREIEHLFFDENLLSNLHDINLVLERERLNIHEERDGFTLYTHPRFATFAISSGELLSKHFFPLLHMLAGHHRHEHTEEERRLIIGEIVKFIDMVSEVPPREWIEHWMRVQSQLKDRWKLRKRTESQESIKEMRRRIEMIEKYRNHFIALKQMMGNDSVWKVLNWEYAETERYVRNGCRTAEELKAFNEVSKRRADLYEEEASLMKLMEAQEEEEEHSFHRLRKNYKQESHKKIQLQLKSIQNEIFTLTQRISELNTKESHLIAKEKQMLTLICSCIMKILSIPLPAQPTSTSTNRIKDEKDGSTLSTSHTSVLLSICKQPPLIQAMRQMMWKVFGWMQKEVTLTSEWTAALLNAKTRYDMWMAVRYFYSCIQFLSPMELIQNAAINMKLKAAALLPNSTMKHNLEAKHAYIEGENRRIARLNPTRARQLILQQKGLDPLAIYSRKVTNRFYKDRRKFVDYEQLLSFQDVVMKPFDIERNTSNVAIAAKQEDVKLLQSEAHWLIGMDFEFQAYDIESKNDDQTDGLEDPHIPYSIQIILDGCTKDLERDANERYCKPWDDQLLLNAYSWVLCYCCLYFKLENERRLSMKQKPIDRVEMLMYLQNYLKPNSKCGDLLYSSLDKARSQNLRTSIQNLTISALRLLRERLRVLEIHCTSRDVTVTGLCKELLDNHFSNDIVAKLRWVLRKFRLHTDMILVFLYALEDVLLLLELLEKLGGTTKITKQKVKADVVNIDEAAISDEEMEDKYTATNTVEKVVGQSDIIDSLFDGKIIFNCMHLLTNYKTNTITINGGIITFLKYFISKEHPHRICIFFDLKYFVIFQRILNDSEVQANPTLGFLIEFSETVVEAYLNTWELNAFTPIELFFGKHSAGKCDASKEESLRSIWTNYEEGEDIVYLQKMEEGKAPMEIRQEIKSSKKKVHWTVDEDDDLLHLFEGMDEDEGSIDKISLILGKPKKAIRQRLYELGRIEYSSAMDDGFDTKQKEKSVGDMGIVNAILNFKILYLIEREERVDSLEMILKDILANFKDVYDTRNLMDTTEDENQFADALQVEDSQFASIELLDAEEYKALMRSCGAYQADAFAQWTIQPKLSQRALKEKIEKFEMWSSSSIERLREVISETKTVEPTKKRVDVNKFGFSSKELASKLLNFRMKHSIEIVENCLYLIVDVMEDVKHRLEEEELPSNIVLDRMELQDMASDDSISELLQSFGLMPPTSGGEFWHISSSTSMDILSDRIEALKKFWKLTTDELQNLVSPPSPAVTTKKNKKMKNAENGIKQSDVLEKPSLSHQIELIERLVEFKISTNNAAGVYTVLMEKLMEELQIWAIAKSKEKGQGLKYRFTYHIELSESNDIDKMDELFEFFESPTTLGCLAALKLVVDDESNDLIFDGSSYSLKWLTRMLKLSRKALDVKEFPTVESLREELEILYNEVDGGVDKREDANDARRVQETSENNFEESIEHIDAEDDFEFDLDEETVEEADATAETIRTLGSATLEEDAQPLKRKSERISLPLRGLSRHLDGDEDPLTPNIRDVKRKKLTEEKEHDSSKYRVEDMNDNGDKTKSGFENTWDYNLGEDVNILKEMADEQLLSEEVIEFYRTSKRNDSFFSYTSEEPSMVDLNPAVNSLLLNAEEVDDAIAGDVLNFYEQSIKIALEEEA